MFTFTCDPLDYKKELSRLTKEAAAVEALGTPVKDPSKFKPHAREPLTEEAVSKQKAGPEQFTKILQNVL